MEINYNLILEYLSSTNQEDSFSNKTNIIQKSNTFNKFSELFSSSYYRYGIHSYNSQNENISFWSSLLFVIDKENISNNLSEIEETIGKLKVSAGCKNNENYIQLVVDYLNLNIIIFNFDNNNITTVYPKEYFNPWLPTIYLAKSDDFWEPIVSNKKKMFNLNNDVDSILKYNILLEEITYFNNKKEFTINDNFKEILINDNLFKIEETNNVDVNETFISENILLNDLSVNKLSKMKKYEIKELLNELKISCNINKPKKKDYIDLICNLLNLKK